MNPNQFVEKRRIAALRTEAEAQIARATGPEASTHSACALSHELRVHQIELEMQNEALRRVQAELEASRDRYLDLYAFAPVGYFTLSREGLVVECNLTGATLLGVERKKMLRDRFDAFIEPDDRDRWHRLFIDMIKHEIGRQKFELRLRRGDGSAFHSRLDCLRVEMDDAPPAVRIAVTDIDEIKRSENLLRASNERVNLLLASTGEGIYAVDEAGICTLANPACARLLGYSSANGLLGQNMHALMHCRREDGSDYPLESCPVHNVVRSAQPVHQLTEWFWRADGSSFPVELSANPMYRDDVIVGAVVAFNDITVRRQAEDELQRLNENLEQRVRDEVAKNRDKDLLLLQQIRLAAIGEVIRNVSHHWRQPLSAVGLILANIKDAYEYNDLNKERLDSGVADGQRLIQEMSATIDRFRGIFTADDEMQVFCICEVAREAVSLLQPTFRDKGIDIEITFENSADRIMAWGYPGDFARALLSVLTNARDAIVKGHGVGKIRIAAEKRDKSAVISISDNGGGLPAEVMDRIFEPYFSTHQAGTGLGLCLAKAIMNNMSGAISLRNKDEGAEVRLTMPLESIFLS